MDGIQIVADRDTRSITARNGDGTAPHRLRHARLITTRYGRETLRLGRQSMTWKPRPMTVQDRPGNTWKRFGCHILEMVPIAKFMDAS